MKVKMVFVEQTMSGDNVVAAEEFVVIYEALQLTAENESELVEWCGGTLSKARHNWTAIDIPTPLGTKRANLHDWIVKDPLGRFYPCTTEAFELVYRPVEDDDDV